MDISQLEFESSIQLGDTKDIQATHAYIIIQVLAFRMDQLVISDVIRTLKDNIEEMDKLSRKMRAWQAQINSFTAEELNNGLYIDNDGRLATHYMPGTDSAHASAPFTEDLGNGNYLVTSDWLGFTGSTNEYTSSYFHTELYMQLRMEGNDQDGWSYSFNFKTTGANVVSSDDPDMEHHSPHDDFSNKWTYAYYHLDQGDAHSVSAATRIVFNRLIADIRLGNVSSKHLSEDEFIYALNHTQNDFARGFRDNIAAKSLNTPPIPSSNQDASPLEGILYLGGDLTVPLNWRLFGNAADGYYLQFSMTQFDGQRNADYDQVYSSDYSQPDPDIFDDDFFKVYAINDYDSLAGIMKTMLTDLQEHFEGLENSSSEILIAALIDNQIDRQQHTFAQNMFDQINAQGADALAIDGLFSSPFFPEGTDTADIPNLTKPTFGVVVFTMDVLGRALHFNINWRLNSATNEIAFDVAISTRHSNADHGLGWEDLVLYEDHGIEMLENEEQSAFWERALPKVMDKVMDELADRISDDAFWKNLWGIHQQTIENNSHQLSVSKEYIHTRGRDRAWYAIQTYLMGLAHTPPLDQLPLVVDNNTAASGFDAPLNHLPFYPTEMGEWLEEILGDTQIYENGKSYTKAHWEAIFTRIDDIIQNTGHLNKILISRVRRMQETANIRMQMVVQDLQKEYRSLTAVANNMN